MDKIRVSLLLLGMLFATLDAMAIGGGGSCCVKKTVGGVAYTLVSEDDTTKYGCQENCIYTRDDQPGGTQICFRAGDLESVCNPDKDEDAVLIVSGQWPWGLKPISEVFFPRTGTSCIVEDYEFPGGITEATLNTIGKKTILCGGLKNATELSSECYELTPNSPTAWTKYADLNSGRYLHLTWESSEGLVLMGGWNSPKTSELVNGRDLSFPQQDIRRACGIVDTETDSVIVTGGFETPTNVLKYSLTGLIEELPTMNQGRQFHGCGSYKDEETNKMVLIVAGGYEIDTTEKHVIGEDSWKVIKPLPRITDAIWDATVSMNNKIYLFGGLGGGDDILEYDDENEGWKNIGKMKMPRRKHATAPIKADQETLCRAG